VGGNAAVLAGGEPAIFDPAVYFGDAKPTRHDRTVRRLSSGVLRGYGDAWPLDPGYRVRKQLYNLYHLLNHLNLFGSSYLPRHRSPSTDYSAKFAVDSGPARAGMQPCPKTVKLPDSSWIQNSQRGSSPAWIIFCCMKNEGGDIMDGNFSRP